MSDTAQLEGLARNGGLRVTVYPAGETWSARFEDNSGIMPITREGLDKETAVQMGAEAVMTFDAEMRVQNVSFSGGA